MPNILGTGRFLNRAIFTALDSFLSARSVNPLL